VALYRGRSTGTLKVSVLALDSPRWADLQHAYGSADDIPPLLRSIAADSSTSSSTDGPWYKLWSALYHQGDVYSASFAAVPHVIDTLVANPNRACFDFFLLPASIEVARHRRNAVVPKGLRPAYIESLERLPAVASAAAARSWDATFCRSALAAVAAAKSNHSTAELLLEIDDADADEVLIWPPRVNGHEGISRGCEPRYGVSRLG
jgi:hypothetical protein